MPERIFIGGLNDVTATSVERDEDGRLRAVIEFENDDACREAIERLRKTSLHGPPARVSKAP